MKTPPSKQSYWAAYAPIIVLLLLPSLAFSKDIPSYKTAKLITLSVETVQKSHFTGEPFGNVHFMTAKPYKAYNYHMAVELEGVKYDLFYEVDSGRDYVPQLQEGDLLEVRMAGDTMFIKRPDGKEFKTKVLPGLLPRSSESFYFPIIFPISLSKT